MAVGLDLGNLLVHLRADASQFNMIIGRAMGTMKRYAKYAAIAGTAQLTLSVRAYAKFEEQMANVSTMLDEHTMKYMPAYGEAMKKMAMEFGEGTETLSKGLYDILSASVAPAKAMKVLAVSAKAAKAGMTTTAIAADAITTVLNSYGMAADEAGKISDILFATVKRGKLTFAELAPNIGKVAAIASIAGLSFEELSAAIATMTRAGLQADLATTSLRAVMNAFIKPMDSARVAAREFGFELNSATLKSLGLTGVLKKLKGATAEQLAAIMPNIRGMAGFAAALKQAGKMADDLDLMLNSLGLTQIAYDKMTNTLMHTFNRFWQAIKITSVQIGQYLEPAVRSVTDAMVEWISTHQQEIGIAFIRTMEAMVQSVEKLARYIRLLPTFWIEFIIRTKQARLAVYAVIDSFADLAKYVPWLEGSIKGYGDEINKLNKEIAGLELSQDDLIESFHKASPEIKKFFDGLATGLEKTRMELEADKALRNFIRGWESLKDAVSPAIEQFEALKESLFGILGLSSQLPKGMEEIQAATKRTAEETEALADAYRAMRGEMGRMSEEVYIAQLRIIEGLRKEYEEAGVNARALKQWYKEQAEVLEIEYLKSIDNVWSGFKAAGMQIRREIKTWGEIAFEFSISFRDSIASGLEATMRDFSNWKDHLLNMFEEIYWSAIRIALIQPFAGALAGAVTGAMGGLFNAPLGSAANPFVAPAGSFGAPTGLQHGGEVEKTGWAVVHKGETFSGVNGEMVPKIDVHIHNEGSEKLEISKAESYIISDQRIIDVTTKAMQHSLNYKRNVSQASRS